MIATLISAAAPFLTVQRTAGLGRIIFSVAFAWLIGIICSVALAAAVRGPGVGVGVAGEHIDASRDVVVAGFWLALVAASAGTLLRLGPLINPQSLDGTKLGGPTAKAILISKLSAIGVLLVAAPAAWWPQLIPDLDRMLWSRSWYEAAFYIATYAVSLIGLVVVPFLRSWKLRIPLLVIMLAGFALDQCLLALSGQPLTKGMIEIGIREWNMAEGFFRAYGDKVLLVLATTALIGLPLCLPSTRRWSVSAVNAVYPIGALFLVFGLCWFSNSEVALPSPYVIPARLSVSLLVPSSDDSAQREQVNYSGNLKPRVKKIVMVVDESVRGDYLDLNNPAFNNTPFIASSASEFANFGVAISSTNCSSSSRMILRTGLQPAQLPDLTGIWRKVPTLWQYAAAANYKTIFIDAWKAFGTFHSHMNTEEARQITQFYTILNLPYHRRDVIIADKLIEVLQRDEPMLIYVNKFGIHMPYDQTFPPSLPYYPPASVTSSLPYDENRRQDIRDYHRALWWSVDGFFKKVLPAIDADTVLIYTSDHGEAWYEGGSAFGHCNGKPAPSEAYVPLLLATGSSQLRSSFEATAAIAYNRASHFHIFPTLLELMGFEEQWVKDAIGPSLFHFESHQSRIMLSFQTPWLDIPPPPTK
jgi:lipid A ethanolaminephosphotransferase